MTEGVEPCKMAGVSTIICECSAVAGGASWIVLGSSSRQCRFRSVLSASSMEHFVLCQSE